MKKILIGDIIVPCFFIVLLIIIITVILTTKPKEKEIVITESTSFEIVEKGKLNYDLYYIFKDKETGKKYMKLGGHQSPPIELK